MIRLVLTRRLPQDVERRAAALFTCVGNEDDAPLSAAELLARCEGAGALLCTPTERLDAQFMAKLPSGLRIVASYSAGIDHIDVAAARARGIVVTNTPDVLTEATADVAILLMLGAARKAWYAQTILRQGGWERWTPTAFLGRDLAGARLGLVGMGRIARATARRAAAFGIEIAYWNRRQAIPDSPAFEMRFVPDLDDLLKNSDFVSLHVPPTADTIKLVDRRRLALLPDGAIVINTARGALIDDDALIDELRRGRLAAGLDVFDGEPDVDPRYYGLNNTYLLPHIGSATVGARNAMGHRALDNLVAFFEGQRPPDAIA
jgi:lactate dehydrogenase-like 2-hydroxyacid dehydrogenase